MSKRLPEAALNYFITELEMCGLSVNVVNIAHLLKKVDFDAFIDHLVLKHIIKCKAKPTTTGIKRLLKVLISYSFNLYYIRGKDMILTDFLSRKNRKKVIHMILFNMQNVLHTRYYNINEQEQGKYLVLTRSQAKTSGSILPKVHDIDKGIDPNVGPENHIIRQVVTCQTHILPEIEKYISC